MKIAVISDTHNFFDPRIPQLFAGAEHILHAGDIGLPWVLLELGQIAPVTAVSGNTDDPRLSGLDAVHGIPNSPAPKGANMTEQQGLEFGSSITTWTGRSNSPPSWPSC